jgi:hypothetical protein
VWEGEEGEVQTCEKRKDESEGVRGEGRKQRYCGAEEESLPGHVDWAGGEVS